MIKTIPSYNRRRQKTDNWSYPPAPGSNNNRVAFTSNLKKERGYQFRYLLDEDKWENESEADKFVPTPYGDSNNSVVII